MTQNSSGFAVANLAFFPVEWIRKNIILEKSKQMYKFAGLEENI